ncbi:ABC transporter permease subunit [Leptospira biflexa]|jgi:microcin C transport system permease protein|uniref:ABC-type transport system, permease component putative signal peptide n=1 Tax=Leptospira biflexa serovar Patoc (strain Patoc 1 / ATCC 23582 / Paris) TaxID=456481 RepID=B0SJJ9_LEPBP|nr:ABC transporter permease subunit [Leptospira biflexa]ABZ92863.1 Permease component of an ABC transporter complex [Leptospira biflexa serovar Patoc strain 'Patoc 1 (Ames)']ABZ96470.1 ABC-type transport system, permease component; putative signal peptide [Leptospira biflexa serovar Patoc strain 'Patoc 1 (Paris)']TGM47330.1 ABC transporter permease subunit [Leptospira biflexa]TGM50204.1 ABC transporter permease subunit [Leptospira biflexa]TGM55475.1 ABC transporter permease subunit [Leptospira
MWKYFLKRFLLIFPTLLGITFLVFLISHFAPGGPLNSEIAKLKGSANLAGASTKQISQEEIELIKKRLHLDKPAPIAYLYWLKQIVQFDLGESRLHSRKVSELIIEKLPVSLFFGLSGFFLTYLICIPLGIQKALKEGSRFDFITSFIIFFTYSLPVFAFAMLLLYLFASGEVFSFFPLGHEVSDFYEDLSFIGKVKDRLAHMFLPVICYVVGSFAVLTLLMKNSLLDQIAKEYVRTALSKGLSFSDAIFQHAFRNSLIPIATGFGSNLTLIFSGSLFIELVFNIDGMGLLSFEAVRERDTDLMMGLLLAQSFLGLIGKIVSDFCYIIIDPRIDFE